MCPVLCQIGCLYIGIKGKKCVSNVVYVLINRKCTVYYVAQRQIRVDPTENRVIAQIICQFKMYEEDEIEISDLKVE